MSINRINTTVEEQNFKFLANQSSILHTVDTNKITINGVNVIVDKPKRGDVMCITHYKEGGVLLDADKQKVVWIDGLSINPTQLSQEYEPVGICLVVKGNKAIVRYREERSLIWSAAKRFKLPTHDKMNSGKSLTVKIILDGKSDNPKILRLTSTDTASYESFVAALNKWFKTNLLAPDGTVCCSAELLPFGATSGAIESNTYVPKPGINNPGIVPPTPDYEIIINVKTYGKGARFQFDSINFGLDDGSTSTMSPTSIVAPASNIRYSYDYYIGRNISKAWEGGCCRAKYFHYIRSFQPTPGKEMTSIYSFVDESKVVNTLPVTKVDFTDNPYCKLLRDTFASYDEYLNSMMVKYPCGAGGAITEFPCGKENTYKLADCAFLDNATGVQSPLYPAANWAASISLNAPKLGKGNWWLPSAAEIVEIMRDITHGTQSWTTNPDIINLVLQKLTSIDNSGWSMLSSVDNIWTSTKSSENAVYWYERELGTLFGVNDEDEEYSNLALYNPKMVSPITIYEF